MKKTLFGIVLLSFTPSSFACLPEMEAEHKDIRPTYNLEKTIDEIKKLGREGRRLALFIGRKSDEPLPGNNDEKNFPEDKGMLWISGDIHEGKSFKNKLSVVMDFNDDSKVSLLNGLFNKVVVDICTWKAFVDGLTDPAKRFSNLLTKDYSSTLMFESAFQYICSSDEISEPVYGTYTYILPDKTLYYKRKSQLYHDINVKIEHIFNNIELIEEKNEIIRIGLSEIKKEMNDDSYETNDLADIKKTYIYNIALPQALKDAGLPIKDPIYDIDPQTIVRKNTTEHLKKFFNEVELVIEKPYYENNYGNIAAYFVAKHPK